MWRNILARYCYLHSIMTEMLFWNERCLLLCMKMSRILFFRVCSQTCRETPREFATAAMNFVKTL